MFKNLMIYVALTLVGEWRLIGKVRLARRVANLRHTEELSDQAHLCIYTASSLLWLSILKRYGVSVKSEFKTHTVAAANYLLGKIDADQFAKDYCEELADIYLAVDYEKGPLFSVLQICKLHGVWNAAELTETKLARILLLVNMFDGAYKQNRLYGDVSGLNNLSKPLVEALHANFTYHYSQHTTEV